MRRSAVVATAAIVAAAVVALTAAQATVRHPPADCAHQSIAPTLRFGGPGTVVVGPLSFFGDQYADTDLTTFSASFLKTGAVVLRGHTVKIVIVQHPRTTGIIGMPEAGDSDAGLAGSKAQATLKACGRHQRTSKTTDGRPATFWSGGFVKPAAAACVPIDVYVDHSRRARRVVLSFGAGDCPPR
jgi:hypothetical protein